MVEPVTAQDSRPGSKDSFKSTDSVETQAVQNYLLEQMRLNHIPSISVAIVRNGRTEIMESYGTANLEWETAATPHTAYQLASTTKPLAGTALMLLVQEGKLSLESSITEYLSDAPTEWKPITIRHLATHSSGISDDLGPDAPKNAEEAVKRLMDRPLAFEPGSRSSYGIGGYAVLQHIIERISGTPFPQFLRESLFEPLGMLDTRFDHSSNDGPFRVADVIPRRAGIYTREGEAQRIFWFHFGSEAYTAGGLLSTAEDLARWAAALDSERLLTSENLDRMWSGTNSPETSDGFGIGWVLGTYRGRRTVGHSGGPALADILRFPEEKLTIIILANQSRMYPYLAQGIADIIVSALPLPAAPEVTDSDPALTERLRAFLLSLSNGQIPEDVFSEEARTGFVPQIQNFLIPYTRSLGAPHSIQLVEERRDGGKTTRTYRVQYGRKQVEWWFEISPEGNLTSIRPFPK